MSRWRPSAGRVVVELLYGNWPREAGTVAAHLPTICRLLRIRPSRLLGVLQWLQEQTLIKSYSVSEKTLKVALREPKI